MLEVAVEKRQGDFALAADFAVPERGVTALFGRSGAGKTTLVNLLAGLARPDRGRIAFAGAPVTDSERRIFLPPERRRIGYVFQDARLFPHLSVARNLRYGLKRAPAGEHFLTEPQVLDLLALEPLLDRSPAKLSGGERQRVALGRALLAQPRLLLLDEPLASLDQARKDEVLPFLERLRDELALPMVYVSHAMPEVIRLADSMVLLDAGRVAAVGSVTELLGRLDLQPLTGRYEAGAVLTATLAGHDERHGLSRLDLGGETLWVTPLASPPGTRVRLRVRARDVAVALSPPRDISIQNQLPGRVTELRADPPFVDLAIEVAGQRLWARITTRAAEQLALAPGAKVYALMKAIAVERQGMARLPE